MIGFFWNLILALAWLALTGSFSALNFLLGFALSYFFLAIIQSQITILSGYAQRVPRFLLFIGFFVKELLRANYKVAFDVLTPPWHMQPGVIALPLTVETDLEITLLANFISLTPGTLSLDVSNDRKVLYIHAMFLQDEAALVAELKEAERRILEVMR